MTISEESSPALGGRTLASLLDQQESLEIPQALDFVRRIAAELAVLHEAGTIHRALTPDAILISDDGDVRLADSPPSAVVALDATGSPEILPELAGLIPPELPGEIEAARQRFLAAGIALDPRQVDLSQLGALLCRLLTGSSGQAYLRSPRVKGKVAKELRPLLERALGCDGRERFAEAREFLAALNAAAGQITVPARNAGTEADLQEIASDEPAVSAATTSDTTPSFISSANRPVDTTIGSELPPVDGPPARVCRGSDAPLPFERLGHYEIVARIGHGGMGDVYRGYERALDRKVAIKVLPPDLARQQDFVRRFRAEATAAAKLIHPNIIQIYFIGEDAGHHYFAMQYVEGESLADLLARRKKLTVTETLAIVEQALAGLGAAHDQGILHRDIKPGNILLDSRNRRALLADFGLVKSLETSGTGHTATGVVMGTVDYISPEQGRGQTVDGRSDLYSLGVLLYHLLSGRLPFEADNPTALIFQHVYEKPPSLAKAAPEVPLALVSMIEKLLAKSPADRYQTAEEVLLDFRAFRARQPLPSQVERGGESRPRTTIIRLPDFDEEEPILPEGLVAAIPDGWWQQMRGRALSLFQKHAPEVLQQMQNTQQQVDGAIANYERRQRDGQKMVRGAKAVLADLKQQARDQHAAARAARERAAAASNPAAGAEAREEQTAAEQHAAELDRQIADQQEQLEPILLRQAQVEVRIHELRNQRDILNARLKAAGAHARVHSGVSRRRRWGRLMAGAVAAMLVVGGLLWLALFRSPERGDPATRVEQPGPSDLANQPATPAEGVASSNRQSQPVVAGRKNRITTLAFMSYRDRELGTCFAAGDDAGGIHLYQLVPNRPAEQYGRTFSHPLGVNQLAFSPDGYDIASASDDQTIAVWNIKSQRRKQVLEGHTEPVVAFQYSADGKRILSASKDGTVRLWETLSEKELKRIRVGGASSVRNLSGSEDGTRFLVGFDGKEAGLSLYNVEPGVELRSFETATYPMSAVMLAEDGTRALSAGHLGMHAWDVKQDRDVRDFGAGVEVAAFTPDARLAIAGNADYSVSVWDVEKGERLKQFTGHTGRISSVSLSADGRLAASADEEGTIRLWIPPPAAGLLHVFEAHHGSVQSVAFAPDGIHAVSGAIDGIAQILRVDSLELGPFVALPDKVSSVGFSADSRRLLYATGQAKSVSNQIAIREIDGAGGTGLDRDIATFRGMKDRISNAVFSPDGTLVAGGSADGSLRVWEVESQREIAILEPGNSGSGMRGGVNNTPKSDAGKTAAARTGVNSIAFSPDKRPAILWAMHDNQAHVWEYEKNNEPTCLTKRAFIGHTAQVNAVQFSPSGRYAITASGDRTLRIWEVESFKTLHELTGHTAAVNTVAVASDGRFLLSGSDDRTVRKWDLETGALLFTYKGHSGPVRSVAISPNSQMGLSGGDDWTVRLWDMQVSASEK